MLSTEEYFFLIFKFAIVGFTSFLIDMSTTYLLKEKVKVSKYIANTCGLVLSACYNFVMNRLWTFHSQDREVATQMIKFAGLIVFNLGMSNLLIYIFSEKLKLNFYISKLSAIVIIMVCNFTVGRFLIFAH